MIKVSWHLPTSLSCLPPPRLVMLFEISQKLRPRVVARQSIRTISTAGPGSRSLSLAAARLSPRNTSVTPGQGTTEYRYRPVIFRPLTTTNLSTRPSIEPAKPTCSACPNTPGQRNVYSFFEDDTHTWQYIVTDPSTKKAIIIDPVLDFNPASGANTTKTADRLLAFVEENGFEVVMLLDTHAHANHLTAAQYLKQQLGGSIPVGIGKRIMGVREQFGTVYDVPRRWWDGALDRYLKTTNDSRLEIWIARLSIPQVILLITLAIFVETRFSLEILCFLCVYC